MKLIYPFFIATLYSSNTYAYFDPGIGSIIIQSIVGFFAISAGFISLYWQKLKDFISKFKKKRKK